MSRLRLERVRFWYITMELEGQVISLHGECSVFSLLLIWITKS